MLLKHGLRQTNRMLAFKMPEQLQRRAPGFSFDGIRLDPQRF